MRSIRIHPRMNRPTICAIPVVADAGASRYPLAANPIDTTIALVGTVVDRHGRPIRGAAVRVLTIGLRAHHARREAITDSSGGFTLEDLDRRHVLLEITRAGFYPAIVLADLRRPPAEASLTVGCLCLTARAACTSRRLPPANSTRRRRARPRPARRRRARSRSVRRANRRSCCPTPQSSSLSSRARARVAEPGRRGREFSSSSRARVARRRRGWPHTPPAIRRAARRRRGPLRRTFPDS